MGFILLDIEAEVELLEEMFVGNLNMEGRYLYNDLVTGIYKDKHRYPVKPVGEMSYVNHDIKIYDVTDIISNDIYDDIVDSESNIIFTADDIKHKRLNNTTSLPIMCIKYLTYAFEHLYFSYCGTPELLFSNPYIPDIPLPYITPGIDSFIDIEDLLLVNLSPIIDSKEIIEKIIKQVDMIIEISDLQEIIYSNSSRCLTFNTNRDYIYITVGSTLKEYRYDELLLYRPIDKRPVKIREEKVPIDKDEILNKYGIDLKRKDMSVSEIEDTVNTLHDIVEYEKQQNELVDRSKNLSTRRRNGRRSSHSHARYVHVDYIQYKDSKTVDNGNYGLIDEFNIFTDFVPPVTSEKKKTFIKQKRRYERVEQKKYCKGDSYVGRSEIRKNSRGVTRINIRKTWRDSKHT